MTRFRYWVWRRSHEGGPGLLRPMFAIAAYLAAMGVVSLVASLIAKETRETDLATVGAA